jgi:hypothetical protein
VAKRRPASRRIPRARRLRRSPAQRVDVTRAEYNRIIDILNERNEILNALRASAEELRRDRDVQFKRIAQLQAELDDVKRASEKKKLA